MPRGALRPVAGHPSLRAAVRAMLADGHSPRDIAAQTGVHVNSVHAAASKVAPRRPAPAPRAPDLPGCSRARTSVLELNYDVARELRPHAARRHTTIDQVAREIVEAVLEQGLVDRVLEGRF